MAIVRTTTKENTTGTAPPTAKPARSAAPPARVAGRPLTRPGTQAKPSSPSQFLQDTKVELQRVKWPTRDEVSAGTIVTVMLLAFFAFYIFGLDFIAEKLFILLGLLPSHTPVS